MECSYDYQWRSLGWMESLLIGKWARNGSEWVCCYGYKWDCLSIYA